MKAVVQRVIQASVSVNNSLISEIGEGLLVLLGVQEGDGIEDLEWLSQKVCRMRILADEEGKMNRSLIDTGGEMIVVSQFTLQASTKKGNRPSFLRAAVPSLSEPLYEQFCRLAEIELGRPIGRGVFGADMKVSLINDGPVTIVIDSRNRE
ncbi:D-tyrosyl-tRNA(Tyr) deacylase [Luteolibacter pohnpeiensis]|uniref:D-aminoacyl-tRNA deacylase n=1 Tax=Luteolibacter pohnpeiensis TaxID=454153 RepID=A0A934VWZ9_9BACT|nr:D-aminoacyl-tRNA deacylase [Luteolibacter pohnpeiensis]MBK1883328.1 D-tyrosyl-tRNA(Tyr) deacylase [Luteolibacter pohnpeiensis]